jgi:hypothetical protein
VSPYFPEEAEIPPYWCPNCKAWYLVPRVTVSCCVLHSPGDCCHMGETRVDPQPPAPKGRRAA